MTTASISECPAAPHCAEAKRHRVQDAYRVSVHNHLTAAKCRAIAATATAIAEALEDGRLAAYEGVFAQWATYAARRGVAR